MKTLEPEMPAAQNRKYLWAMVALLLLAFALGAGHINADIMWVDELYSLARMGALDPPLQPPADRRIPRPT